MRRADRQRAPSSGPSTGWWSSLPTRAAHLRGDLLLASQDAIIVGIAFAAALLLRYEGQVPTEVWQRHITVFTPMAVVAFLAAHTAWGIYGQIWRHASLIEARRLVLAGLTSIALLVLLDIPTPRLTPLSVVVLGGLTTILTLGATRFQSRMFALHKRASTPQGMRIAVVGAGETGASLIKQMQDSPRSGLVPVAVLDDDPRKHRRSCRGIPVAGGIERLPDVITDFDVHQIVLAIPSAPRDLVTRVVDMAERAGVALRVAPETEDMVRSGLRLQDLRRLRIDDLLGREQVVTDLDAVATMIRNRRVLITGAGGSIGSEIARQVASYHPAALLLLDHDETHLHDTCATLEGPAVQVLADIRDRERIFRILAAHRPHLVFHAAAHKHVPILEDNASEAVRTNIVGTRNLVDAAVREDVDCFVLISTDKAVRPTSVMGASKRFAEHLVLAAADDGNRRFCGVRFGNVLGSRGSVIPTFVRQIESGGPVTVTNPLMTRYFMSIPEAVQLVLQAATMAEGREIFMLRMGEPVRILDLAKRMIRLSGRRIGSDIELHVVGPRPGEKLEEELHTPEEVPEETIHPSIVRLQPRLFSRLEIRLATAELAALGDRDADDEIRRHLFHLAQGPAAGADEDIPSAHTDLPLPYAQPLRSFNRAGESA